MFRYLTDPGDRAACVAEVMAALLPGGNAVIDTFGPDFPDPCSGLPVARYSGTTFAAALDALAPGPDHSPGRASEKTSLTTA